MVNSIEDNAYRILGLDITANQKDILKRYKEITNRLKIDDYPEYDLDIKLPKKFRSESSVVDALKRLQSQKSDIKEYFFWFQINDSIDEKVLKFMQSNNFADAIKTWKNASRANNSASYFYKKNLALLYCLLLFDKKNDSYLEESLSLWHDLLNSEKFWSEFAKRYISSNEQIANGNTIQEFRTNAVKQISDIYAELHKKYKDNKYIKDFEEIFGVHGERTEKDVLGPVYQSIYDSLDNMRKIEVSDNKKIDEKDIKDINRIIEIIEKDLKKLKNIGAYENDQSKVVRDNVAEGIRSTSILIYNSTVFLEEASELLKNAIKISGTESLRNRLEEDLKKIKENKKNVVELEIPGFFSDKKVIFNNTFLEYENQKIPYKDIESVSYLATSQRVYGIPAGTKYKFTLTTGKDEISVKPGDQDTWGKLINLSKQLIEPLIIKKIVEEVFEKGETVSIGDLELNKKGYSKIKFFGGTEQVLWSDPLYIPIYNAGNVVLFKDNKGVGKSFMQILMSTENAVILPELIRACVGYFYRYGKLKKEISKTKEDINVKPTNEKQTIEEGGKTKEDTKFKSTNEKPAKKKTIKIGKYKLVLD